MPALEMSFINLSPGKSEDPLDKEVGSYLSSLYDSKISVDEMVTSMESMLLSHQGRRLFDGIIKVLISECKFFSKYPISELRLSAELIGALINRGLLRHNSEQSNYLLNFILDCLQSSPTSKSYQFGYIALLNFYPVINNYPLFSTRFLSMQSTDPALEKIQHSCRELEAKAIAQQPLQSPVQAPVKESAAPSKTASSRVGELESLMDSIAQHPLIEAPPSQLAEKVYASFNNICSANVKQAATELRQHLHERHFSWLSLYIIKCRASKEPNLQDLFLNFLDFMAVPKIFDSILSITYACVKACLQHIEEYKLLSPYRTLLKNMGLWLGKVTIGRDLPLITNQVDIKRIILEGYERGSLVALLPFVCKVLESTKESNNFNSSSPWTSELLLLLIEVHDLPNLKTNLVFEIAILFKSLSLDLDVERSKLTQSELDALHAPANSPDFNQSQDNEVETPPKEITQEIVVDSFGPDTGGDLVSLLSNMMSKGIFTLNGLAVGETKPPIERSILEFDGYVDKLLKQIPSFIVISPTIALFEIQPHLKSIIPLALDRAVRKVLLNIENHCISIAKVTCLNLINKDFKSDLEGLGKWASLLSITSLAGTLALATCKEPLRLACHESLRLALHQHRTKDSNDQILIEQIVQVLTNDNLIALSQLIERIVIESATYVDIFEQGDSNALDQVDDFNLSIPYLKLAKPPTLLQLSVYRKLYKKIDVSDSAAQPNNFQNNFSPAPTSAPAHVNSNSQYTMTGPSIGCPIDDIVPDSEFLAHLLTAYYKIEAQMVKTDPLRIIETMIKGYPSLMCRTGKLSGIEIARRLLSHFYRSEWGFYPKIPPINPVESPRKCLFVLGPNFAQTEETFIRAIKRWSALCRDPLINTQGSRLGYIWTKFDEKMGLIAMMEKLGRSAFYKKLIMSTTESDFDCLVKLIQAVDLVQSQTSRSPTNLTAFIMVACDMSLTGGSLHRFYKILLHLVDGYLASPTSQWVQTASLITQSLILFTPPKGDLNAIGLWFNLASHAHLTAKLLSTFQHWPLLVQLIKRLIFFDSTLLDKSQLGAILCDIVLGCPEFIVRYHLSLLSSLPIGRRDLWNLIVSAVPRNSLVPDPRACERLDLLPGSDVDPDKPPYQSLYIGQELKEAVTEFLSGSLGKDDSYMLCSLKNLFLSQLENKYIAYNYTYSMNLIFGLLAFIYESSTDPCQREYILITYLAGSFKGSLRIWMVRALTAFLRFPTKQTLFFSNFYQWIILEGRDDSLAVEVVSEICQTLQVRPYSWGVTLVLLQLLKMNLQSIETFSNQSELLNTLKGLSQVVFKNNSANITSFLDDSD